MCTEPAPCSKQLFFSVHTEDFEFSPVCCISHLQKQQNLPSQQKKKTHKKPPNPQARPPQAKINKLTFTPPLEAARASFLLISFGGKRSLLTNDTSVGFLWLLQLLCHHLLASLLCFQEGFFSKFFFFFPFLAYAAGSLATLSALMGNLRDF